jgi:hypothetical protein
MDKANTYFFILKESNWWSKEILLHKIYIQIDYWNSVVHEISTIFLDDNLYTCIFVHKHML